MAGFLVAIASTSTRSEGGKAPRATRARRILQATQALLKIAISPTANGMAVTVQILGHLQVRRAVWRRRPEDHLTVPPCTRRVARVCVRSVRRSFIAPALAVVD